MSTGGVALNVHDEVFIQGVPSIYIEHELNTPKTKGAALDSA